MIKVRLIKDTRIGGVRVLAGAELGFDNNGQARYYTDRKLAELVSKPKRKATRAKSTKGDAVDATADGGTSRATSDTSRSQDEHSSK